ncbi:hypothetical protein CASFOL_024333 [Castilleja foliolosa]|uniref:Protein kinase domain-containing protein n=1 Tax=Castilleja foliolosa TaxID=1961234 RepID=A0ABD3CP71_9LAMI
MMKSLVKLFIFHSLMITTNSADSNCQQQSLQCGNLGSLQFPLTNTNQPTCGLITLNCTNPSSPTIQLGDGGPWYDVLRRLSENRFRIRDPVLQTRLNTSSCNSFTRSLNNLPNSPSIHLNIPSPVLTSFQCNDPPPNQDLALINAYFFQQNYTRFGGCSGFVVFYRAPANGSYDGEFAVPEACQAVRLPFRGDVNWEQGFGVFSGLSGEFDVEWNVSDACLECVGRGGICRSDSENGFFCRQLEEEGNKYLKMTPEVLSNFKTTQTPFKAMVEPFCAGNRILKIALLIGGVVVAVTLSITFFVLFFVFRKGYKFTSKWPILHEFNRNADIEVFLKDHGSIAHKRYKYSDLKKITKSFKQKLGEGGYGSVYKGQLPNGRLVAVKMLNESKGNGGEFVNEVTSISQTSHVNIVTLLGFCFEGSKRALVYEFMPNGSFEKYLQNSSESWLGWEKLSEISLGVARGLEYLHQGCNTRILHFDMKPHNILLDKDFNPKISDFGLAKLCPNRSSIVSMLGMRGTIGYIAPEVFCRNFGEVSYKSDVYSYGMMVLEVAGGSGNVGPREDGHTSDVYFPNYVYKELGMEVGTRPNGIVNGDGSEIAKRKMIIVGLWCIQIDPKDRPSMSKVVEMLEGKIESLEVPPKPYLSSPPRPGSTSSQPSSTTYVSSSRSSYLSSPPRAGPISSQLSSGTYVSSSRSL